MFCDNNYVSYIELYNFDTKSVKNMSKMFSGCSRLNSINLVDFNMENVLDISNIFQYCSDIQYI